VLTYTIWQLLQLVVLKLQHLQPGQALQGTCLNVLQLVVLQA
jgi:hypothetical protein